MKKIIFLLILLLLIFNITDEIYQPIIFSQLLNNTSKERPELPAVIIMYDDGNIEDYTRAFPVHQEYEVPGVVAVNPEYIGNKNKLDEGHLHLLEKKGWEIANHGQFHAGLIYNSTTNETKKGDKKLYVKNSSLVEPNYDYILFNSRKNISEKIEISEIKTDDSGERYLKLDRPVENNYSPDKTYIKLSDKAMETEIVSSKNEFKQIGIEVNTFVYPYNGYIQPARELVKDNYENARGGRKIGLDFPEAFLNTEPVEKYSLRGISFENHLLPEDKLQTLIEKTIKEKGLLIMYAHTRHDNFSEKRLEHIIQTAQKNNMDIITFQDLNSAGEL